MPRIECGTLLLLTPVKQSPDHNIVKIHRSLDFEEKNLLHVAGGEHAGIIVNKLTEEPIDHEGQVELSFSVCVTDGVCKKQEKRSMSFHISEEVDINEGRAVVHQFFKQLVGNLPKDYASFMKRVLSLLKNDGYPEIESVLLDFKIVAEEEQVLIPDAAQYDSSSEVEEVTAGHVQEVLEHAYPNGLSLDIITEALRCSHDEATQFLLELEASGIAQRVGEEWIRLDQRNVDAVARNHTATSSTDHPTVAIISCLFVEKQAIDALIEDCSTIHKYKSGGDSNIYTLGRIGQHRVVATKLALIGDSREAITSAGSITTRLLGNFQKIEHVFIVGVGGAVPHFTDARLHSRLGDVIISASRPDAYVYAHDLLLDRKTENLTGFAVRKWNPTDNIIEKIVREGGDSLECDWSTLTNEAIGRLRQQSPDVDFTAPPSSTDVLAVPVPGGNVVVLPHPNADRKGFEIHLGSTGAVATFKRNIDAENEEETIGQIRERFSSEYHLRALDVGFDSVVASIVGSRIDSWALVRGVADYQHGQSRSSKKWQAHASARAAAITRAIIERLPADN